MKIVISGLGGRGVLFLTQVIANAAMLNGKDVICAETHGMAQRGASVISHIKIGNYMNPLIGKGQADIAICLESSEVQSALSFLKLGGRCFINATTLDHMTPTPWAKISPIDADKITYELNHPRGANLVILGYTVKSTNSLDKQCVIEAIKKASKPQVKEKNLECFLRGYEGSTHSPSC